MLEKKSKLTAKKKSVKSLIKISKNVDKGPIKKPTKTSCNNADKISIKKQDAEKILIKKTKKQSSEDISKIPMKVAKKNSAKDVALNKSKKIKKAKKKPVLEQDKIEEKDEVTDPRLLKYISGEDHEKFCKKTQLTDEKVTQFFDALLKLCREDENAKRRLFIDKDDVLMMITCFKIPKTPTRQLRFILPRMIISKDDRILLFVRDIMKGRRNTEKSEEHFKELLEKHHVEIMPEIMSLTRVKNEHDQFELKRNLANSYEAFLADGRISGHLAHLLGKTFTKKRKLPTPVKMDAENLNEEIIKGLRRTIMPLHATGDCYAMRIGTTTMKSKHLMENFMAVCKQLKKVFPGGWENIRFIRIKTSLSIALPIYATLKSRNKVPIPKVQAKRPKAYTEVEGELSTLSYDNNVIVTPEGKVTVINKKKRKLEKPQSKTEKVKKVKKEKEKVKTKESEDEKEEEDEETDESEDEE